jgi:hypothetical protein
MGGGGMGGGGGGGGVGGVGGEGVGGKQYQYSRDHCFSNTRRVGWILILMKSVKIRKLPKNSSLKASFLLPILKISKNYFSSILFVVLY